MKSHSPSIRLAAIIVLTLVLNSCVFEDPVFVTELGKVDGSLNGVWVTQNDDDPRSSEYAVCAPIDDGRYLVHYPAQASDSFYYEAKPLQRRGRTLLQLRILSTFKGGSAKSDSKSYTLLWILKNADDRLLVRALKGDSGLAGLPSEQAGKTLEDPSSDWGLYFDEGRNYRRLAE